MSENKDKTGLSGPVGFVVTIVHGFEKGIVMVMMLLMLLAVGVSAVELGVILYEELMRPPKYLLNIEEMLSVFGFFMMVLIGLELLETIRTYLENQVLHVEVVLLVAIIAVARKVIILDIKDLPASLMLGIAAVMVSLAVGYFLIRKSPPTLAAEN